MKSLPSTFLLFALSMAFLLGCFCGPYILPPGATLTTPNWEQLQQNWEDLLIGFRELLMKAYTKIPQITQNLKQFSLRGNSQDVPDKPNLQ